MSVEAVNYSAEDLAVIARLCPQEGSANPDAWGADLVKELRSAIKAHYIAAQGSRCCYCNRHLGSENHRVWDIDHIVSRATHPAFMFEPMNLAATCPDCNIAKRDLEVLWNRRRKTYPKKSDAFRIFHPHFDDYEHHIFRKGLIYLPKTEKGKRTIYACDLLRFAQKYIDWPTSISDARFEAEVEAVMEGGPAGAATVKHLAESLGSGEKSDAIRA